jgi:methylated-DNA-protein-cysteine methyltransferase-like protein
VVNRNGVLTGREFFGGDRMAMLLRAEGVTVKDNKVQQFKNFFWDPLLEL